MRCDACANARCATKASWRWPPRPPTLRTLLPELERGREGDAALREDVGVMTSEVDRCRDILRGMVEYGRQQLAGTTRATTLGDYVRDSADRFRLLRPDAELSMDVAPELRDRPISE